MSAFPLQIMVRHHYLPLQGQHLLPADRGSCLPARPNLLLLARDPQLCAHHVDSSCRLHGFRRQKRGYLQLDSHHHLLVPALSDFLLRVAETGPAYEVWQTDRCALSTQSFAGHGPNHTAFEDTRVFDLVHMAGHWL